MSARQALSWKLPRAVAERMPELVLLLVGAWHEEECENDADFAWCRASPGFVWLGHRSDDEAAAHPLRRRRGPAVRGRAVE